jgi:hypothetical protein
VKPLNYADLFVWVILLTYVTVDFTLHWKGRPWTRSNTVCTTIEARR